MSKVLIKEEIDKAIKILQDVSHILDVERKVSNKRSELYRKEKKKKG
ncbi:MAG: hypothetical protein OXH36_01105 [Bdellovibrionales bacterium]|nr:hypothetical protein [Bdellovibrionales bacterium]